MNVITILKVLFIVSFAAPILRCFHIRFYSRLYAYLMSSFVEYRTRAVERAEEKTKKQAELGML
jgi:hypothetical protein